MIINKTDLPTNGYLTFRVNQVDIPPLDFGTLMKYLGDEQLTPSREYIRALKFLVEHDPGIGELSILDADYLMYLFKSISSSKETKITLTCKCSLCNHKHSRALKLNEVEFMDVNKDAMRINTIKLKDREIRIRYSTINDFIGFFSKLERFEGNRSIDLLKLVSMLDLNPREAFSLIDSCIQEDIALINYLDSAWFKLVKPVYIKCPDNPNERGTSATFQMSAVDIFQSIVQLNPIAPDKISFGEAR